MNNKRKEELFNNLVTYVVELVGGVGYVGTLKDSIRFTDNELKECGIDLNDIEEYNLKQNKGGKLFMDDKKLNRIGQNVASIWGASLIMVEEVSGGYKFTMSENGEVFTTTLTKEQLGQFDY